jgi:hypothetical protein
VPEVDAPEEAGGVVAPAATACGGGVGGAGGGGGVSEFPVTVPPVPPVPDGVPPSPGSVLFLNPGGGGMLGVGAVGVGTERTVIDTVATFETRRPSEAVNWKLSAPIYPCVGV